MNPAAAVLDDVKIVSRVHGYTVTLIELARQITDLVEGRDDLAGLALDDAMRELFRFTTNMKVWAGSREKASATVEPPLCSILPSVGTVAGCHG